jgi:FKBP-type peptidyl-prolyl cis-trans isomerase FkpA
MLPRFAFIFLVPFSLLVLSCEKKSNPETDSEKTLYALGAKIGASLRVMNLSPDEARFVARGFSDSVRNETVPVEGLAYDNPERAQKIQDLLDSKSQATAMLNEKLGKEYLEKFIAEGGKKTDSGLAFKIIEEGTGASLGAEDVVEMHYEMSVVSGKLLQSTKAKGFSSRLPVNRLLKGWAEGLRIVKVGGKIDLVIPPDLAYGKFGAPPDVPSSAYIKMNIEVLSVTSPADRSVPTSNSGAKKAHGKK